MFAATRLIIEHNLENPPAGSRVDSRDDGKQAFSWDEERSRTGPCIGSEKRER